MSSLCSAGTAPVGGKAAALRELERAGFRIPETIVSPEDPGEAFRRLGPPVAVRSSATVEDGAASSFAGQFESHLDLATVEEVEDAVRSVRDSVHAPSVLEYCRKNGIDPSTIRMGVIVQKMIRPELAGVAFGVHPVTGAEEVVVEACAGLADELLQGRGIALPTGHPLLERHRSEIERTVRAIQRHFGAPQDVEFAIENGTLYVLQARPITRIHFAPEIGEWTNADFRDGGVSSAVCTPLMWSLYDTIWEEAFKGFLREIRLLDGDFLAGRMFFGRPYWNLGETKKCLARLPGFVEREFDKDLSVDVRYEGDGIRTPLSLKTLLRAIPTVLAIGRIFREQGSFDRRFLNGGFEELHARDFRTLLEHDYRIVETNYFRTIYCASLAKLDFLDSFPDADYTKLVTALPPMSHLEPVRALREGATADELVRRFPYRGRRELDLSAPRWDEDREWVEEMVRTAGSVGGDPRPAYEAARAQYRSGLPWWKRRKFDRKLDRLREFVWLREEMRDRSSRMYWRIRKAVLEIARERGLGEDIFFMTWREILSDDRSNVERAREVYETYRHFRAPNEIGSRYAYAPTKAAGSLRGIGASPGRAEGTARVAHAVEETARIEKGAILVCPFTDPGWTPVLDRVSAVVTETGGLLSHAAVICREYGIPAVLNVPQATTRLRDGVRVVVDGNQGTVEGSWNTT